MNAIATQTQKLDLSLGLLDPATFEHMQRVGRMLAVSPLFPQHLRQGSAEIAMANGVLVMNMALRLREDPLSVAQNIYFVGGKPGWSSSYCIAKANQHGVFRDPIDWEITGRGDTLSVTAFAVLAKTGRKVSTTCDMTMAKAEGWTKNPKYQSMPATMLRYRSASALIRFYCPEVMIGLPSDSEVEMPMRDVSPDDYEVAEPVAPARAQAVEAGPIEEKAATKNPHSRLPGNAKSVADVIAEQEGAYYAAEAEKAKAESERGQDKPKAATRQPDLEQFMALYDMLIADISSGASVEDVEGMYGPQIEQMQDTVPEMHAKLMAAFAEAQAA